MQKGKENQLMFIKNIILVLIGLSGGFLVAGGIFAFITMIGVIPRLVSRSNTAKYIFLYENLIIAGGFIGNLVIVFNFPIPIGTFGMAAFGVFSGIYVGCLAMALAEMIKVFPIMVDRLKLTIGIPYLVMMVAFGKGLGAFYQLFTKWS
jgi:stage V sporulation protein AB